MDGMRDKSAPTTQNDKDRGLEVPKPGVGSWLPLTATLLAALVVIPILWVLLAHWAGLSLNATSSMGDLLATIGGVMGAIFTVGGLVIALVAVLTQLSIEGRIRREIGALLPQLDKRAQRQIEAHIAFTRADEERDWRRAEDLAKQALEKWPSLRGVRSLMGERISNLTMEWFVSHEIEGQRLGSTPYMPGNGPTMFSIHSIVGMTLTPTPSPLLYMSREEAPFYQALEWLKAAIKCGEDEDSSLRARVALVQGMSGHFIDMKEALLETLKRNSSLRDYFLEPWNLAMLVYACRNAASLDAGLRDIGTILNHPLQAPTGDLLKSLSEADMGSHIPGWNVYWVAVERPGVDSPGADKVPSLVTLHILLGLMGGSSDKRTGSVQWRQVGGPASGSIPADRQEKIGIDELAEQLSRQFILICQYQPGWATWRIYH